MTDTVRHLDQSSSVNKETELIIKGILEILARTGLGWLAGKAIQSITGFEWAPAVGAGIGLLWPGISPAAKNHVWPYIEAISSRIAQSLGPLFVAPRGQRILF